MHGHIKGNHASKLIKTGQGTLLLDGDHQSFIGDTLIDSGKISFKGRLGGNCFVKKSSSLSGSGVISKDLTIEEGGSVHLGENDNLSVAGNYLQSESGDIGSKVNRKGKSSLIDVEGVASIEKGIIEISGDYRLCSPYIILTAKEGVEGVFDEPHFTSDNIQLILDYPDRKKVTLRFVPQLVKEC